MTTKKNETLREEYTHFTHKSGLEIYLFPKKHSTAYAVLGTRFGSIDTCFKIKGEKDFTTVPEGIAHFLEHKLFEEPDGGDAFSRFAEFGGNANAYTSFGKTVYLVSCTDCFEQNLEILLDFVTHPHFTEQTVRKELGIIGEEIGMYEDNSSWQSYLNMVRLMYVNHPIRFDIAGSKASIAKITPEMLYRVYGCFYDLNNMALCVCGDVTLESIERVADKILQVKPHIECERKLCDEPDGINQTRFEREMEVGQPLFSIGIKERRAVSGADSMLLDAAHEILLQLLFGRSSDFFSKHYESGLINGQFGADYEQSRDYAFINIGGAADDPDAVLEEVKREIAYRRDVFFPKEDFERVRRSIYADNLFDFDSTDSIANTFLSYIFDGADMLDYPDVLANITYEQVREVFMSGYDEAKTVISIIKPFNGGKLQ